MNCDTIFIILSFLDVGDVITCSLVNKLFNNVTKSQIVWHSLKYCNVEQFKNHYDNYKFCYGLTKFIKKTDYFIDDEYDLYESKNLSLSKQELFHIPNEIGLLKNLKRLYLHDNKLKNIPTQIGLLTNLKNLDCSNNKIEIIPTEIGQLINLKNLQLYSNKIKNIPSEMGQMKNLVTLSLFLNQLKNIPTEIGILKNLNVIMLSRNKFLTIPNELKHINIQQV
jgi:hypothetical protein